MSLNLHVLWLERASLITHCQILIFNFFVKSATIHTLANNIHKFCPYCSPYSWRTLEVCFLLIFTQGHGITSTFILICKPLGCDALHQRVQLAFSHIHKVICEVKLMSISINSENGARTQKIWKCFNVCSA